MDGGRLFDGAAEFRSELGKSPVQGMLEKQAEMEAAVREYNVVWQTYQQAGKMSEEDLTLLKDYDKQSPEARRALIFSKGEAYAALFVRLLDQVAADKTQSYVLKMMEDMLVEDPDRVALFTNLAVRPVDSVDVYAPLVAVLGRSANWYASQKAVRVVTQLLSVPGVPGPMLARATQDIMHWVGSQLTPNAPDLELATTLTALSFLLQRDENRVTFATKHDGVKRLSGYLTSKAGNVQILYQVIFNLWMLSYHRSVAKAMDPLRVVVGLIDVLRTVAKAKVVRVAIATLRNLTNLNNNNEVMISADLPKSLRILSGRKWSDEDIEDDLEFVEKALEKDIHSLGSLERYEAEVFSGKLEWSHVHKNESFWRENVHAFINNDRAILRVLVKLLERDDDSETLAVACHDLGEFARFHPNAKMYLSDLGAKARVMALMTHADPNVQKNALLAVQKLMVTNWEHLHRV